MLLFVLAGDHVVELPVFLNQLVDLIFDEALISADAFRHVAIFFVLAHHGGALGSEELLLAAGAKAAVLLGRHVEDFEVFCDAKLLGGAGISVSERLGKNDVLLLRPYARKHALEALLWSRI